MRHDVSRLSQISIGALLTTGFVLIAPTAAQQQQPQQQPPSSSASPPATVNLDELEKHPEQFLGKTVTVEGEVDRVLGPNLFTIDEKNWVDLDREMPVVVPEPFAAIVKTDAPVRVTGTVQKVPIAQIERRGGILSDPKIKAEIETQPALVASAVTTIAPGQVAVNLLVRPDTPVGTSGSNVSAPVTDVNQVTKSSDTSLVGKRVNLKDGTVVAPSDRGFWIRTTDGERIFVMPANKTSVKAGQTAGVEGVVLELPEGLRLELNASGEPIYIYAERVTAR
jgi:hypothetical protein